MAVPTSPRRVTLPLAPERAPRPAKRPPLRLVDDARLRAAHVQRRRRLVVVLAAVLAAGTLFLLAAFNAVLVTGQSHLDHLQGQVERAQAEYSANRLELAQLEAPDRIVEVAQQRLGMVPPQNVRYLTPSEAMAAQVARGQEHPAPTTSNAESGTSWAATKPYLGATP